MSLIDNHVTEAEFRKWEADHGQIHEGLKARLNGFKCDLDGFRQWGEAKAKELSSLEEEVAQFRGFREEMGGDMEELKTLLKSGLPDQLRPFFDEQLAKIDNKLDELRRLKQQTESVHAACQEIHIQLNVTWKSIQKHTEDVIKARDAAVKDAASLRAMMAGCGTFVGRLRWLFCGRPTTTAQ